MQAAEHESARAPRAPSWRRSIDRGRADRVLPERGSGIDRFEVTAPVWVGGRRRSFRRAPATAHSRRSSSRSRTSVSNSSSTRSGCSERSTPTPPGRRAPRRRHGRMALARIELDAGMPLRGAADEMRGEGLAAGLLPLCGRVARSFARLHQRGVVHGQVHPRHVLVDGDRGVALIDFSVAASVSDTPPRARLEARFGSLGARSRPKRCSPEARSCSPPPRSSTRSPRSSTSS